MPRTNETPEQRKARTSKARETLAQKFADDEARREHYRQMAIARWANRKDAGGPDAHHAAPEPDHDV